MTSSTGSRRSPHAFSLVEMLVVLGILGALMAMSVPVSLRYVKQLRFKAATRQMIGLILLARSTAISSHEEHAVIVDGQAGEVRVENLASGQALERLVRLPSAVSVSVLQGGEPAPQARVTFRATGALTGPSVSLVVSGGERQQTITVIGATGAVSVQ